MEMAHYSPELLEQTITVFKRRTGRVISEENAREAVDNISGFFRVLQEWAEAEDNEICAESSTYPDSDERTAQ